jgi:hypothetical protein
MCFIEYYAGIFVSDIKIFPNLLIYQVVVGHKYYICSLDSFKLLEIRAYNIILTIFFALESIFKIIAYGFAFNGENSYLRGGSNVIDFIVVIVSIISLAITSNKLKIVKILRLLRVLRPLRVISRNKGLKIGI